MSNRPRVDPPEETAFAFDGLSGAFTRTYRVTHGTWSAIYQNQNGHFDIVTNDGMMLVPIGTTVITEDGNRVVVSSNNNRATHIRQDTRMQYSPPVLPLPPRSLSRISPPPLSRLDRPLNSRRVPINGDWDDTSSTASRRTTPMDDHDPPGEL